LYYAVLEGVALALRANLDALADGGTEIRLIGGGALSPMWAQLLADVTGRHILVTRIPTAATAFGAFRIAATCCGMDTDEHTGERRVGPRPERAARAERRRLLFNARTGQAREWAARL
jgi:xylulokinase